MTDGAHKSIFQIGDVLNNTYRIEAILGRGGTSEVYRARSEISGQAVALKALRSEFSGNEDFLTLMTREEAIREVRHDAIVRYFHNQRTADGVVFLVMDYVHGVGLDKKLKDGGMPAEELLTVARRVAEGLRTAHAKNITHRDLSPDNIILRNGDPADPVIIDFGIAKDSNPGAETVVGNEFAGKYAYAAPEQLSGKSDARSDFYALGALLLATFRGRSPDVGDNPMEVIERKTRPLDTEGVPEPLRSVIERLTQPDPDLRFQTADELLDALPAADEPAAPGDDATEAFDTEATVIAPLSASLPPAATTRVRASGGDAARIAPRDSPPAAALPATPPRKRRSGMLAALAVALVAAIAAGGYFAGLFGTSQPLADPFTLTVARAATGGIRAEGHVPSAEVGQKLEERIAGLGGSADLTLAQGPISEDWGTGVLNLLEFIAPLEEMKLEISNDDATISGLTQNRSLYEQLSASLADPGIVPGLFVTAKLELGPRILPASRVREIIDANADCGELVLLGAPPTGYAQDTRIAVLGRVARPETRTALRDAITEIAGTRDVVIDTEVLNPTLCTIDAALPNAPAAGFDIVFSQGDTGETNPTGRFFVDENPVIDVTIPADITDGYMFVSALDVSGNVFHLLPNLNRDNNRVADLRAAQSGPVTLRLAYPVAESEASGGKKLAFLIDGKSLGKSKIMVIHADEDIFGGLRPTSESAEGFAEALRARSGAVRSLDSRILISAEP